MFEFWRLNHCQLDQILSKQFKHTMWFDNATAVKTHQGRYSTGFCQSQPCTKLKMSIILAIFEIGLGMNKRDRKENTNMILLWP